MLKMFFLIGFCCYVMYRYWYDIFLSRTGNNIAWFKFFPNLPVPVSVFCLKLLDLLLLYLHNNSLQLPELKLL